MIADSPVVKIPQLNKTCGHVYKNDIANLISQLRVHLLLVQCDLNIVRKLAK